MVKKVVVVETEDIEFHNAFEIAILTRLDRIIMLLEQ